MKTVVIDPGHGGSDPGAIGPSGLRESDVNLAIAWHVIRELHRSKPPMRLLLTRGTNQANVELSGRVWLSNVAAADLFASIHCNGHENANAGGFEVYSSPGLTNADGAAADIYLAVSREIPEINKRHDYSDGDPDKEASFYVLKHTKGAAVLVECAFITNPEEEQWLASRTWRKRMGLAIAKGILVYLA